MKILLCTPFRYPGQGGSKTHISMLSKGLFALGHQVTIISASSVPRWLRIFILSGPQMLLNKIAIGWGTMWFLEIISLYFWVVLRLMLRKESYDIINVQHVALLRRVKGTSLKRGIPVILTVHGDCTNEQLSENRIRKGSLAEQYLLWLEREFYARADKIVSVDTRLKNHVGYFVKDDNCVTVIKNFIDTDAFSPNLRLDKKRVRAEFGIPLTGKVVLCPRRLVKKNGVVNAALAVNWVVQNHPEKRLVLVYAGEGDEKYEIQKIIKRYKLGGHIILLGSVRHSEMSSLYSIADVVIIPSIRSAGVEEATSISALEGMASGIPVIASNIGGLGELIENGKDGILVPDGDYQKLAKAITEVLEDKRTGHNLSYEARNRVLRNHSHLLGARRFVEVYKRALEMTNNAN